jgi:hypothetical protein
MSIFDAPLERCEAMQTMVVTDQTQPECAHEHACPPGMVCPLCSCFTGHPWFAGKARELAEKMPDQ